MFCVSSKVFSRMNCVIVKKNATRSIDIEEFRDCDDNKLAICCDFVRNRLRTDWERLLKNRWLSRRDSENEILVISDKFSFKSSFWVISIVKWKAIAKLHVRSRWFRARCTISLIIAIFLSRWRLIVFRFVKNTLTTCCYYINTKLLSTRFIDFKNLCDISIWR